MARPATHDHKNKTLESFEHPETHKVTSTMVPTRTKAETARLKRLIEKLDPERDFAVERVVKGHLQTLNVRAANGPDAARLADALKRKLEGK